MASAMFKFPSFYLSPGYLCLLVREPAAEHLAKRHFLGIMTGPTWTHPPFFILSGETVTDTSYRLSWLAAAAIAILRITIGAHFLDEGITKLTSRKPFSG